MKILSRYIGTTVLVHCGIVMMVLLSVYVFTSFITEIEYVGRGHYTFIRALAYVAMLIPRQSYELFPMVALLGTMLGLGSLAGTSELTVMRAAGVSIRRMSWAVLKAGMVLVVVAVILGEVIAPPLEKVARVERAKALSQNISVNTEGGLWVRDETTFVNIRRLLPNGVAADINLYHFDDAGRLLDATSAVRGKFQQGQWRLFDVKQSVFDGDNGVTLHTAAEVPWKTGLTPDVFQMVAVPPENLSAWDLYNFIGYLHSNGLESTRYDLAFWVRIMAPFATAGMVLMALPFVFGSLRSANIGQRILVGALLGIGFYLFNAVFNRFGVVYNLQPWAAASLPTAFVFLLWGWMMRRVR
jgi:lipopolysaccharide export system permease protein